MTATDQQMKNREIELLRAATIAKVFLFLWGITFVLYLPATNAGKAGDYYLEWLNVIQNHSFRYFLYPPHFPSLYPFTQAVMYGYYKVFGAATLPWHILALTTHVANATLLFAIVGHVCIRAGIRYASFTAMATAVLFCISPYNTEVIVHEPCYHYTLGFLLVLCILRWSQQFADRQRTGYAVAAGILYFCSSYAIEIFYLTPLFVCSLAWYYCYVLNAGKIVFRKILLYFVAPQIVMFVLHLIVLYAVTSHVVGHDLYFWIGEIHINFLSKTPKYLYHILTLGRFFSENTRRLVYTYFDSGRGMISTAAAIVLFYVYNIVRYRKIGVTGKLALLACTWMLLCSFIVCLLIFPALQLVALDRYLYFMMPFAYLLLLLGIGKIASRSIFATLVGVYVILNVYYTVKLNNYWSISSRITKNLVHSFPVANDKTVVLLNIPENMNGIVMIGSQKSSAFKLMHDLECNTKTTAPVYDVASFNMIGADDGAHVTVLNDSTLSVVLTTWGTWWWFNYMGAYSYKNSAYRLNMVDPGHRYELTLQSAASGYLILYCVGDKWKVVDWNKKNVEQN